MNNLTPPHKPVLLDEVLQNLDPAPGKTYLDLTAGYGGHSTAILDKVGDSNLITLVDRDVFAFEYLKSQPQFKGSLIINSSFEDAVDQFKQDHMRFDMILLDLGVSSPQLDIADRGFSFTKPGPLDMRMDQSQDLTAAEVVNKYSAQDLEDILRKYAEIKDPKRLVKKIIAGRPYRNTSELSELLSKTGYQGKVHPATLVFQALRIEVNDELGQIERTLPKLVSLLSEKGKLAVITFHSLEDRIVKDFFKSKTTPGYEQELKNLTKKPISGAQDVTNPRARSAKLRAVAK